ncbi:MAG TPA: ferrous iron transport protein B [Candidatus Avidesulfovibrio excrementigallinarum]|nr:ferrous iron transport protein B [Candidatus Avidesulfovibrio excrementigallinarum]
MKTSLVAALAGNPNSGKTTAFNAFTGAHQHVGNYPGITVERKEGPVTLADGETLHLIDLPGVYSLSAYTQEETVARQVLASERPDVVIDILNAGALERNLYLAIQLLELGIPLVLGLNMMDEARDHGVIIDMARLSERLGVPVRPAVARTGYGLPELLRAAVDEARKREGQPWKPLNISYGPDLDPVLTSIQRRVEEARLLADVYPPRWVALKFLEQDREIIAQAREQAPQLCAEFEAQVKEVAAHLHATLNTSPEGVIADYRYGAISSILRDGVLVRQEDRHARRALSDRMDKVLTHGLLGPLIMLLILYLIYQVTFTLGEWPMELVTAFFGFLRDLAENSMSDGVLKSMVISGIIDGVGGVMSFVPLIMIMFLLIAILEDSGYMARMAYMLDRIFRVFGLHGASVMPFIVGGGIAGGCAVPGVLAARTLRSPREKLATLLTVPFMACGAKLPVFILFAGVFFPAHQAMVIFGLTLTGWIVAMLCARLLRSTVIRGPATPFVMELPPYRFPTLQGLCIHTLERTWEYFKKAWTVILAVSIVFWAAMTYPRLPDATLADFAARQTAVEALYSAPEQAAALAEAKADLAHEQATLALRHTIAGRVGLALEPLTQAAGFDWRTDIALIGGFAAKEVIVATMGTAYSLGEIDAEGENPQLAERIRDDHRWNPATALALLVFVLLYAPCLVTLVAIRHETGSWRWPLFSLIFNTLVAYTMAVIVRHAAAFLL